MAAAAITKPKLDLDQTNADLQQKDALEIVQWASESFGDGLVLSSSFGAQAAVMLHLCTRVVPDIPIIWIDTGFLFAETYQFAKELTDRLALNLKIYQSPISPAHMHALHGELWNEGEDGMVQYNQQRKVEPLRRAMKELRATGWLSGVRAQQTSHRAGMKYVDHQDAYNVYEIHPILKWNAQTIHNYLTEYDLPRHPLWEKGYKSIGDWHSTRSIKDGEDERAGRFHGLKSECGIHLPESKEENDSMGSAGL